MTCTDTTTSTLDTLNVHTLADPDQGPLFHIGGTCLDSDGARALIDHLAHLLEDAESTEDTPTAEATMPEQPRPGYMFPATRKWHGEQVPASHVHRYPTVDGRDAVNLEYVATPEGPVVLVDGSRPISLDATHTLMQDMALYRSATHSEDARQARAARATA